MKKIAIIGPESTGKSTLSEQLASHFKTSWCPEYAREYLTARGAAYSIDDLLKIARGQIELEDQIATANQKDLLFIDTNLYVIKIWSEFVFSSCNNRILDWISERRYDLYLLCNVDLPWQEDPLREYPDLENRKKLYHIYRDCMIHQSVPWVEVAGIQKKRLNAAIEAVCNLLNQEII